MRLPARFAALSAPSGVTSGSYTSPLIDLDDPANFTAGRGKRARDLS